MTEPEADPVIGYVQQKLATPAMRLSEHTGVFDAMRERADATGIQPGDIESLQRGQETAARERARMRTDRSSMDEELARLEVANDELQKLNDRLTRSIYWRRRRGGS